MATNQFSFQNSKQDNIIQDHQARESCFTGYDQDNIQYSVDFLENIAYSMPNNFFKATMSPRYQEVGGEEGGRESDFEGFHPTHFNYFDIHPDFMFVNLPDIFQPSLSTSKSAADSKVESLNLDFDNCPNLGLNLNRVNKNRKDSDSSIKFRDIVDNEQQFKYSDICDQNSSTCLMISPPRCSTSYSTKKQKHTIYNHPAQDQVKNKLVKKFEQKQKARTENKPLYARDELSKKIIRQLTKYDKDQIKKSVEKSTNKKAADKKDNQLQAVKAYLQGLLDMSPQAVEKIIDEALSKVVTFYCSIKVRNQEQKLFGKKIQNIKQPSQGTKQQKRIMKKAKQFLKKTDKKLKIKTSDRNMEITGSKESMIQLFQTQLGRKLYYHTFCNLWQYFMENNLEKESQHWKTFETYKQSIILRVEGPSQGQQQ